MSPKESVTNDKVVELIKSGVEKLGVRGLARAVDLSPAIITRYTQGKVGEPSQATLGKLADYFGVSVAELRGEKELIKVFFDRDKMTSVFKNAAVEISTSAETIKQVGISIILLIQEGASDKQILDEVNGWKRKLSEMNASKKKEVSPLIEVGKLSKTLSVKPDEALKRLKEIMKKATD